MKRFVILKHEPGEKLVRTGREHLDWMFEIDGCLRTFSTAPISFENLKKNISIQAVELNSHRKEYLKIRGDIGRGLGVVSEVASGIYELETISPDLFSVELRAVLDEGEIDTRAVFKRIGDSPDDGSHCGRWLLTLASIDSV